MADFDTELREGPETGVLLSSVEGDGPKRRHRLWLLMAAHAVVPFFCIWWVAQVPILFALEHLLVFTVFGFVFAQTSLLGFWAVFSPAKWWIRLASLTVAIIYMEFLLDAGGLADIFNWLAAMATGSIAAVFGVIRWRYADVRRLSRQLTEIDQEGLKFSIRGLMLFTFVVAITIVGLNAVRENAPAGPSFLTVAVWSLSIALVGLAGVWAALGLARPTQRSVIVLLISAVLGALFVYTIRQASGETYFYIVSMMLIQAGVLIASLLVVRSCGYRLVRNPATDMQQVG